MLRSSWAWHHGSVPLVSGWLLGAAESSPSSPVTALIGLSSPSKQAGSVPSTEHPSYWNVTPASTGASVCFVTAASPIPRQSLSSFGYLVPLLNEWNVNSWDHEAIDLKSLCTLTSCFVVERGILNFSPPCKPCYLCLSLGMFLICSSLSFSIFEMWLVVLIS